MAVFVRFSSLLTMSVFCCSMAFSQTQQPVYTRHVCVKVKDGKRAEFAAYLPVRLKEAKVRVDSGLRVLRSTLEHKSRLLRFQAA